MQLHVSSSSAPVVDCSPSRALAAQMLLQLRAARILLQPSSSAAATALHQAAVGRNCTAVVHCKCCCNHSQPQAVACTQYCRTAEPCCREVQWRCHLHTALHCRGLLRSAESTCLTVLHQYQCSMHCAYSEPVQSARGDNVVLLQLPGQTQCSSNLQELAARQCQSTAASGVPQDMHISAH